MKSFCVLLFAIFLFSSNNSIAQVAADYAVQIDVSIQGNPARISLNWINDIKATQYQVYRKSLQANSWGNAIATLPGTASLYVDDAVQSDTAYEYKLYKTAANNATAYGYVYAGIKKPAIHYNGRILVLVDSIFVDSLANELLRFEKDLASDGWDVTLEYFSRTDSVSSVKNYIVAQYNIASNNVKAVLLIGHIAVPYSGDLYPDGHDNHKGAWPADVYYGDMDGIWTDVFVNSAKAPRPENINVPGDGKFDQTYIPTDIDLQVSRIDFFNMPASGKTEFQLMKNYLNRNHAYRKKEIVLSERGLVDDNFGAFSGEAFAANGFRNFAPLVGKSNILSADFRGTLDTTSYLWAYGCGGGNYSGAGGIGTSTQIMNQNVNAIFTLLFGSYFGDWDSQNNFLRSPLCANIPALTCAWAGRPNWVLNTMGLGLNIGYGTLITQNNSSLYSSGYGGRFIHIALMGDLTLKQNVLAPPQSVSIASTLTGFGKTINWTPSSDVVLGYYVYRSENEFEGYRLISNLISGNSFTDSIGTDGTKHYLVRAMKLETTPSGSYYNLSEGVGGSAEVVYEKLDVSELSISGFEFKVYPNPASDFIIVECNNIDNHHFEVQVYNLLGELVQKEMINEKNQKIDIGNLSNGAYIVAFRSDKIAGKQKVMISR